MQRVIFMRLVAAIASLALLSACSGGLQELKTLNPQAEDFDSSLAAEYLGYADSQSEQGHPIIAGRFAAKGLAAARHETVVPDMPPLSQEALMESRRRLMAALTEDVKRTAPQQAARAQLLFDCLLAQEKLPGQKTLAPCEEEFASSMNELQAVADEFIYGDELEHAVEFEEGSDAVTPAAHAAIYAIAEHMKGAADFEILLADHAGREANARALARKRIAAIRKIFAEAGIAKKHISYASQGSAKEVLISSDDMEHNAIDITVRTSGGR